MNSGLLNCFKNSTSMSCPPRFLSPPTFLHDSFLLSFPFGGIINGAGNLRLGDDDADADDDGVWD